MSAAQHAEAETSKIRKMVVTAMLSALATVLMFLSFKLPFMPSFISMDFSELPALIASFALGPLYGVAVCFIKNLINLMRSTTGGVGELSNFILGCAFVVPAGLFYKHKKNRRSALIGSLIGAASMAIIGFFSNLLIVYPVYAQVFAPMDVILGLYQEIMPSISSLPEALLKFNMPFTFCKGLCNVIICFLIYKRISPVIKGTYNT